MTGDDDNDADNNDKEEICAAAQIHPQSSSPTLPLLVVGESGVEVVMKADDQLIRSTRGASRGGGGGGEGAEERRSRGAGRARSRAAAAKSYYVNF